MNHPLKEKGPAVLLTVQDGRATITLNEPERGNAMDIASVSQLAEVVDRVACDASVRVLILRAKGPRFCVGADLRWLNPDLCGARERVSQVLDLLNPVILKLRSMAGLVVAGVQGAVAGGGVGLMAAADFVLAAEGATVSLGYPRIGATPDAGATFFLPRLVGERKALQLMLDGKTLTAEACHRLGLFNFVVQANDFPSALEDLARRLASGPAGAFARTKALTYSSLSNTLPEQLEAERSAFLATASTPDFYEGVRSFLQKRAPDFNSRPNP
jgi:2-(1,2-epoxy-1,2-dihydrophenyl)acetyl-CoA isomerase